MAEGSIKYPICTVDSVRHMIQDGRRVAIDVSHIDINAEIQGNRTEWLAILDLLANSSSLFELHMSQRVGIRDGHTVIHKHSFGLDYVRMLRDKVPIVLESNMKKVSREIIQNQINLILS
jgi:hypothetical protein